jgi:hypothetical protein
MGLCHYGMASRLVVGGGTTFNMEGSCKVLNKESRARPPVWRFGVVVTTPQLRNWPCYKTGTCASDLE